MFWILLLLWRVVTFGFNKFFFLEQAKWYMKVAEGGYVYAMFNISLCFSFGEGLTRNHQLARKWMKRAADRGHSKAQFEDMLSFMWVFILVLYGAPLCFEYLPQNKLNMTSWHFCWICDFATLICFRSFLIRY